MLDAAGLRGPLASLAHFATVLGTEQALLPALGVASPTPSHGAKAAAIDAWHHVVYAGVTGAAFDYLQRR